jgi:hypothetical protein
MVITPRYLSTLIDNQILKPEIHVIYVKVGFSTDIKNHQFEIISNDLEELPGRRPSSLKDSLKEIYKF